MVASSIRLAAGLLFLAATSVLAQDDGYIGYSLKRDGDPESAVYGTASTDPGLDANAIQDPDVFLNASVYVGEIDIEVDNITAKVNLEAQVLNLLKFSAGVDASIDKVRLTIQNVSAEVLLEARLENVFLMVDDVLSSIDLNPIIATLGNDVNSIVNTTVGQLENGGSGSSASGGSSTTAKRSNNLNLFDFSQNVLYSVNDYSGKTHTNRVLSQNGSIYDVSVDNNGHETGRTLVGNYATDMTYNGHNRTILVNGQATEYELQYLYAPMPGVEVISTILLDSSGKVLKTQVIAEAFGGGSSTVSDDEDL
jgi:hypothetical protein